LQGCRATLNAVDAPLDNAVRDRLRLFEDGGGEIRVLGVETLDEFIHGERELIAVVGLGVPSPPREILEPRQRRAFVG
jgi:hypothetical protein